MKNRKEMGNGEKKMDIKRKKVRLVGYGNGMPFVPKLTILLTHRVSFEGI